MKNITYRLGIVFMLISLGQPMSVAAQKKDPLIPIGVVDEGWQIETLSLRGGSYLEGYKGYELDFQSDMLSGFWDRLDENLKKIHVVDSRKIGEQDEQRIKRELYQLEQVKVTDASCGTSFDGPEDYVDLRYNDEMGQKNLIIVAEQSRIFVCGDLYATQESFQQLAHGLEEILPEPRQR